MLVYGTKKCSICGEEVYDIIQNFKRCTKCGNFVCSDCQDESCVCGNHKFEDEWEKLEKEHPGSHFIF